MIGDQSQGWMVLEQRSQHASEWVVIGSIASHLIGIVTSLATRGIGCGSIIEAIDIMTPGGRLVFHLFGALGQFEAT